MDSTTWNWKNWKTSQSDPAWKEARTMITASVVPEFFGLGYRAWKDLHCTAADKGAENEHVQRGKDSEPKAASAFATMYHSTNQGGILAMAQPGLLVRETTLKGEVVSLGASLDRLCMIYKGGTKGPWKFVDWVNLEIKVPIKYHGLPSEPDQIKPRYLIQVIIQMWVTNLKRTWLMFWREDSHVVYEVTWDEACDQLMDLILPLVPKMEYYYLDEVKDRPRINPFKGYCNDVCKILEKVQVQLASF